MSLDHVVLNLEKARVSAGSGDAVRMDAILDAAELFASKAGQDISLRVAEIRKEGYSNAIPFILEEARGYAYEGRAETMDYKLSRIERYAAAIGQDIPAEAAGIRTEGYRRAIPLILDESRRLAALGRAEKMDDCLYTLGRYGAAVGYDHSQDIESIRTEGYNNAIVLLLEGAMKAAMRGKAGTMNQRLYLAGWYGTAIGRDISQEEGRIRDLLI